MTGRRRESASCRNLRRHRPGSRSERLRPAPRGACPPIRGHACQPPDAVGRYVNMYSPLCPAAQMSSPSGCHAQCVTGRATLIAHRHVPVPHGRGHRWRPIRGPVSGRRSPRAPGRSRDPGIGTRCGRLPELHLGIGGPVAARDQRAVTEPDEAHIDVAPTDLRTAVLGGGFRPGGKIPHHKDTTRLEGSRPRSCNGPTTA
jgi:hypothetical protein